MTVKKVFLTLVLGLLLLVVVLFGGGMLLDGDVEIETEATLDASQEVVYSLLQDPAGVLQWWAGASDEFGQEAMEGMTSKQGEGPATGPGATVLFEMGEKVAEEWTLVSVDAPNEAVWDVDFQMFVVRRTLRLEGLSDGKTKVVWRDAGTFESPLSRWFTLMPKETVIQNFQNALKLLDRQAQAESAARAEAEAKAKAEEVTGDDDSANTETPE